MNLETPPLLAPPPHRGNPPLLAWLVIASCVAFLVIRNAGASGGLAEGSNPLVKIQLKLLGRMAIGSKAVMAKAGQPAAAKMDGESDGLLREMDDLAASPDEKADVAIMAGEIKGPDEALTRLDKLEHPPPSPDLAKDLATLRSLYANGVGALDASAREGLVERHDFFAQVALAYGVAADEEPRKSVEESGQRVVIRAGVAGLILLLILVASFGLFITAIVLICMGKIQRAYQPDPTANSAFLEGFAIYLAVFIAFGLSVRFLKLEVLSWEWLALLIIPLVWHWTTRRGVYREQRKLAFGWHAGRGIPVEMAMGLAGYLACLPIEVVGMIISVKLIKVAHADPTHPIIGMFGGNIWQILAIYGLACGLAPVLEETMFRGALFHHLRRRWGWAVSTGLVSLIFAAIHPQGWTMIPALGSVAVVLAILREWRGSIIAPMTAHAFSNFVTVSLGLLLLR